MNGTIPRQHPIRDHERTAKLCRAIATRTAWVFYAAVDIKPSLQHMELLALLTMAHLHDLADLTRPDDRMPFMVHAAELGDAMGVSGSRASALQRGLFKRKLLKGTSHGGYELTGAMIDGRV